MALKRFTFNRVSVQIPDCPDTQLTRIVSITHLNWNTGEEYLEIPTEAVWINDAGKIVSEKSVNLPASYNFYCDSRGIVIAPVGA